MSNQTRLALINMLSDGHFHSGEILGEMLGITRSAVAKHIKILQSWGLDLYRVQGKGYCLSHPIELLNRDIILAACQCPHLDVIPVIDSTNQYLMDRIGQMQKGSVCLAEYQEAGRGRRGRQWISPFGSNLYLSMYWRLDEGIAAAMGLSLVVGIAVAEALTEFGAQGVQVKWPNDLFVEDKKLAGILIEMTGQSGDAAHLVIGLGLNVFMSQYEGKDIDQAWTNLQSCCAVEIQRNKLISHLIQKLSDVLTEYERVGLNGFVNRWNALDKYLNRPVTLLMGDKKITGIARGINHTGALLLETAQGITPFVGGEISVRGQNATVN